MNPIIIDYPSLDSAGMPVGIAIESGCTIHVSGHVDQLNFPAFVVIKVVAQIGGGAPVTQMFSPGVTTFQVNSIPGARWASPPSTPQTVSLVITIKDTSSGGGGAETPLPFNVPFIGTSGPSECQYYGFGTVAGAGASAKPIQEVMPRYFRVTAEFGGDVSFGKLAGGLLSLNPVYLAYDPTTSTPECPIWRGVGALPGLGSWQLHVVRNGVGYEARLSNQTLTETCVLPALVTLSRHWSFRHKNLMHGVIEIGTAQANVTLTVEPA